MTAHPPGQRRDAEGDGVPEAAGGASSAAAHPALEAGKVTAGGKEPQIPADSANKTVESGPESPWSRAGVPTEALVWSDTKPEKWLEGPSRASQRVGFQNVAGNCRKRRKSCRAGQPEAVDMGGSSPREGNPRRIAYSPVHGPDRVAHDPARRPLRPARGAGRAPRGKPGRAGAGQVRRGMRGEAERTSAMAGRTPARRRKVT